MAVTKRLQLPPLQGVVTGQKAKTKISFTLTFIPHNRSGILQSLHFHDFSHLPSWGWWSPTTLHFHFAYHEVIIRLNIYPQHATHSHQLLLPYTSQIYLTQYQHIQSRLLKQSPHTFTLGRVITTLHIQARYFDFLLVLYTRNKNYRETRIPSPVLPVPLTRGARLF